MTKLYIDTNIFVGFYEDSNDQISIFDEISMLKDYLIGTEQSRNEFHRNRARCLAKTLASLRSSAAGINPHTTAIVQALPGYGAVIKARDAHSSEKAKLESQLRSLLSDDSQDVVLTKYTLLFQGVPIFDTTASLIDRANKRKLLGDPPSSKDKYTIGDELIWETLLENLREDLVLVSKDQTFIDNEAVLRSEFHRRTSSNLVMVTNRLSKGLAHVGKVASKKLLAAEEGCAFFQGPVYNDLASALDASSTAERPLFMVIYDDSHPTKSQLKYSLGYFMQYDTTKKAVANSFVQALVPSCNAGVLKYLPQGESLENCLLVIVAPDGNVFQTEPVYANPEEGLNRVRRFIHQWSTHGADPS